MPRISTSHRVKIRVAHLLRSLLDYANQDLENGDRFAEQLTIRWVSETQREPKLVVQTKLKYLVELLLLTPDSQATKEQVRHDLRVLREFLGILEDNRARTQGADDWHFTLKLWHRSTAKNLAVFEQVWTYRKSQPSGSGAEPNTDPGAASTNFDRTSAADSLEVTQSTYSIPIDSDFHSLNYSSARHLSGRHSPSYNSSSNNRFSQNLPSRHHAAFIGSKGLLTRLLKLLSLEHPPHLLSVIGAGGIGKTTLVLEAAHRCLAAVQNPNAYPGVPLFDAIIFTSAKSQDWLGSTLFPRLRPERNLQDIFRVILRTLNCREASPPEVDQQIDYLRDLLSQRQTLLIIDNLETLDDQAYVLSFVQELPPTVKVVLTSRIRLDLGTVLPMSCLPLDDGLALIQHQAHIKAVQLNLPQAEKIYQKTGGLPLAITYMLGQAAVYGISPETALTHSAPHTADLTRYCFDELVQPLRNHLAHQLLMAIALFPCPTSIEALAQVAFGQTDVAIVQRGLAQLHQLSLIELNQQQYQIHSLTRQYSIGELNHHPVFAQQVRDRWVKWYLQFLQPYGAKNWRDWQAYEPLEQEWENLREAVEWCRATDRYEDFKQFWQQLQGYTQICGYWPERLSWMNWLTEAAELRQDHPTVANATYHISRTLSLFNQPEQTQTALGLSQQLWETNQAQELRVDLAIHLAALHSQQQQYEQALTWLDQGQMLLQETKTEAEQRQWVEIHYFQAEIYLKKQQYESAKRLYLQALQQAEAIGWQRIICYVKGWLAATAIAQGNLDEAENLLKGVFSLAERNHDKRCLTTCQRYFALLEKARGNRLATHYWAKSAQESFERLNMKQQAAEMNALLKT